MEISKRMKRKYMTSNLFKFTHPLRHAPKSKQITIFEKCVTPNSWENHLRRSMHLFEPLVLCCIICRWQRYLPNETTFHLVSSFNWCVDVLFKFVCDTYHSAPTLNFALGTRGISFLLYFSLLNNNNNSMILLLLFHIEWSKT